MALIEMCDYQPEDHKLFKKVLPIGVPCESPRRGEADRGFGTLPCMHLGS